MSPIVAVLPLSPERYARLFTTTNGPGRIRQSHAANPGADDADADGLMTAQADDTGGWSGNRPGTPSPEWMHEAIPSQSSPTTSSLPVPQIARCLATSD
jgi:hypothetical protein